MIKIRSKMNNRKSIHRRKCNCRSALFLFFLLFLCIDDFIAQNNYYDDTVKFKNGSITEYIEWKDTHGEIINAHDGGIIYIHGKYYWYGLALRPLGSTKDENNGAATTTGINLYSSKDLHNWLYEGVILPVSNDSTSPLHSPMRLERPKILFNKKTHKFVMWFHYVGYPGTHGQAAGFADAGVAVADSITGPFKFLGYQRPIDSDGAVKDCSLYADGDTAYFIYDRKLSDGSRCLHIVKLTDDYLNPTTHWSKISTAHRREAPMIIKHKGMYYLITSDVSGWKANAAKVYKAANIMGSWEEIGNPCTGEGIESTYHTQGTYAFYVQGIPELALVMLERHNTDNFIRCSYVWLPIVFTLSGELLFPYKKEWDIHTYLKEKQNIE
jgi:hypothetical protein